MPDYQYLIIGGGMAAGAAVKGIREIDSNGKIGMIAAEPVPPYKRPPLSKKLWKGKPLESIWIDIGNLGVDIHLGRRAQRLDLRNQTVLDDQGDEVGFAKLLLATGSVPRTLPLGAAHLDSAGHPVDRIIYFRSVADYERLRRLAAHGAHFAVVGGGFIGSEIAAALNMAGKQVTFIVRGASIGASLYPGDLGAFLNDYYREKGVNLHTKSTVSGIQGRADQVDVEITGMSGGGRQTITVDGVIIGIGVEPDTALAGAAGLIVDNGIWVDEFLRAGHPAIYAAGDVASFYDTTLDTRRRVEHEDNANVMGRLAGRNMAGAGERYTHLPFFYSDLFDLGYEAVGETNARLETVADWKKPNHEGVVYYLKDGRVRGVLLWNVWEQVEAARALIREPGPFKPQDLKGRLPG